MNEAENLNGAILILNMLSAGTAVGYSFNSTLTLR